MTKDIKFLKNCMKKEKFSLETTKNPRLQKIIEKRIVLYAEQIKVLEEIEEEGIKDANVLDYLFKSIKKYVRESWGVKTIIPRRLEPQEQKSVQKKFLKNLLTNELPKNCNLEIEFAYDYTQDSLLSIDLKILENNIPFFKDTFVNISKEELQKIAIFYIKTGGKSLEKQIRDRRKDSEEVIKQNSVIVRKRKKFLKILKEFETTIKTATEGGD